MKVLNCTQHNLTPEMIQSLGDAEIVNLRDADPKLFGELSNVSIDSDLSGLARDLNNLVDKFDEVILPIGSPAFMWEFAREFTGTCAILFAHSNRIVTIHLDSTKTVSFVFEGWIVM